MENLENVEQVDGTKKQEGNGDKPDGKYFTQAELDALVERAKAQERRKAESKMEIQASELEKFRNMTDEQRRDAQLEEMRNKIVRLESERILDGVKVQLAAKEIPLDLQLVEKFPIRDAETAQLLVQFAESIYAGTEQKYAELKAKSAVDAVRGIPPKVMSGVSIQSPEYVAPSIQNLFDTKFKKE